MMVSKCGDCAAAEVGESTFVDGETSEGSVSTNEVVAIGELVLASCEVGIDRSGATVGIKASIDCTSTEASIDLGDSPSDWTTCSAEGV